MVHSEKLNDWYVEKYSWNDMSQRVHFFLKICIVSKSVWWIRSESLICSILFNTCGQGIDVECQLNAIVQWIELKRVWINLVLWMGTSGIDVNNGHIWGVKEIVLPVNYSILVVVCCQIGFRYLQFQNVWVKLPWSGQPLKHLGGMIV